MNIHLDFSVEQKLLRIAGMVNMSTTSLCNFILHRAVDRFEAEKIVDTVSKSTETAVDELKNPGGKKSSKK